MSSTASIHTMMVMGRRRAASPLQAIFESGGTTYCATDWPSTLADMEVFVELSGLRAPTSIEARVYSPELVEIARSRRVVVGGGGIQPGALSDVFAWLEFAPIEFPAPGVYSVQLFVGGELCAERALRLATTQSVRVAGQSYVMVFPAGE